MAAFNEVAGKEGEHDKRKTKKEMRIMSKRMRAKESVGGSLYDVISLLNCR